MFSFYISTSCKASRILKSEATAASRLVREDRGSGFGSGVFCICAGLLHASSKGKRCCTDLSRKDFPARSFAAHTPPSRPSCRSAITPNAHFPRLHSSPRTITTSPTFRVLGLPPTLQLCRSLRANKYSRDQRFQSASLQDFSSPAKIYIHSPLSMAPVRAGEWTSETRRMGDGHMSSS